MTRFSDHSHSPESEPDFETGPGPETVTSLFNRVLAMGIWVVSAALGGSLFFLERPSLFAYLVPLAFVGLLAWEGLWQPALVVSDAGIGVRNPFRTVQIPWNALVNVETRFALTLFTPGRRFEVWVAPSPGRSFGYREANKADRTANRLSPSPDRTQRPADLKRSESGSAASLVLARWDLVRSAGAIELGVADTVRISVQWSWPAIAALAALFVASIPALLVA